jgi:hypothetical protein
MPTRKIGLVRDPGPDCPSSSFAHCVRFTTGSKRYRVAATGCPPARATAQVHGETPVRAALLRSTVRFYYLVATSSCLLCAVLDRPAKLSPCPTDT